MEVLSVEEEVLRSWKRSTYDGNRSLNNSGLGHDEIQVRSMDKL